MVIRVHLWLNKFHSCDSWPNKNLQAFYHLQVWFILPGFYCQITFPALIMMFSGFDGKRNHQYANNKESTDLDFLFHVNFYLSEVAGHKNHHSA